MRVIKKDSINSRRDRRRPIEVPALMNSNTVQVHDISLGGLGASFLEISCEFGYMPRAGDEADLRLSFGEGIEETFRIQIAHCDVENSRFGAKFVELNDRQYRIVERLTMGRRL